MIAKPGYMMLWFDNNPKTKLDEKIKRAASFYYNKYGEKPNCCEVSSDAYQGWKNDKDWKPIEGIEVMPSRYVFGNNFTIGVKQETIE